MLIKRILYISAILLFLCLSGFCGWQLLSLNDEYSAGDTTYASLRSYVRYPEPTEDTSADVEEPEEAPTEPPIPFPEVDFEGLMEVNEDTCAWLYAMDGDIDLPVVLGKDNNFYLRHMLNGEYNRMGCLFMDYRCRRNFSTANSIIYGHNMLNDSMFAYLERYKERNYWQQQPTMFLMTPDKNYVVRIFAGYVATVNDPAWEIVFRTRTEWQTWMEHILDSTDFTTDVRPRYEDRILTLSTCSYDFNNARYVLFGVLEPHELP